MARLTARRLREMGVRAIPRGPRPSTRAHPAGLTSRELEIVSLIVSSILSKLGVRSRVDVAREAIRLGIVQSHHPVAGPAG